MTVECTGSVVEVVVGVVMVVEVVFGVDCEAIRVAGCCVVGQVSVDVDVDAVTK